MTGKVFLVGAGPGDPQLITLKGIEILKKTLHHLKRLHDKKMKIQ